MPFFLAGKWTPPARAALRFFLRTADGFGSAEGRLWGKNGLLPGWRGAGAFGRSGVDGVEGSVPRSRVGARLRPDASRGSRD
eukprot:7424116-Alexandrium_andersonii.AAC.1